MDIKDIQNLIKFVAKSGASEVKLEMEDIKITIKPEATANALRPLFIQQPTRSCMLLRQHCKRLCRLLQPLRLNLHLRQQPLRQKAINTLP